MFCFPVLKALKTNGNTKAKSKGVYFLSRPSVDDSNVLRAKSTRNACQIPTLPSASGASISQ